MSPRAEARSELPVYLSLSEAGAVVSLSVKTIRRRIAEGTIPAYTFGHGTLRIRLDDLENAMRQVPNARRSSELSER